MHRRAESPIATARRHRPREVCPATTSPRSTVPTAPPRSRSASRSSSNSLSAATSSNTSTTAPAPQSGLRQQRPLTPQYTADTNPRPFAASGSPEDPAGSPPSPRANSESPCPPRASHSPAAQPRPDALRQRIDRRHQPSPLVRRPPASDRRHHHRSKDETRSEETPRDVKLARR